MLPGAPFDRAQAQENLQVVLKGYEAVAGGEIDSAGEMLAENATWTLFSSRGEPTQVIEGREGIVKAFREFAKQECARAESLPFGDFVVTTHAVEPGKNCMAVAWILSEGLVADVISLDITR